MFYSSARRVNRRRNKYGPVSELRVLECAGQSVSRSADQQDVSKDYLNRVLLEGINDKTPKMFLSARSESVGLR